MDPEGKLRAAVASAADQRSRGRALLRLGRHLSTEEGHDAEANRVLGDAMETAREAEDTLTDAEASLALGELALLRDDLEGAPAYLRWACRSFREVHHAPGAARAYYGLGEVARVRGELDVARIQLERALTVFERTEDDIPRAETCLRLGEIAVAQNDPTAARRRYREALEASARASYDPGRAHASYALGRLALDGREPDVASRYLRRAAEGFRGLGAPGREGRARRLLGAALVQVGSADEAVTELEGALELIDDDREVLNIRHDLGVALRDSGRAEEAADHFAASISGYAELSQPTEGP